MREPVWLTETLVMALHEELIARFGGHGGVRDRGLLQSALARPRNLLAYGEPILERLAASYAFGLARNHPFVDGNKRVALAAIDVFLQLNGRELVAPEAEAVVVMRELAAGKIDEAALAAWIEANVERLPKA
ncbi:MAG: type II toxin-antitoxin system death-on-curing family toxin [Kiloniellales bacterium]